MLTEEIPENLSLLPNNPRREVGGLRTRGYFKKSHPGKPLISVLTVARNAAEEIERTVKSVLNQTYDNVEYIIIDGASTDGTLDIIKKYSNRVDYWISEMDRGVYYGMNKGIDLASGDWINFMNSGDRFYKPDVIQQVVDECAQDIDFIYGDHIYGDNLKSTKAAEFETLWQRLKNKDFDVAWMGGFPCHQSLFSRATVLKKYKYDVKYKLASEQNFLLTVYSNNHKYRKLDLVVSFYNKGGMSYKFQIRSLIERWRILRKFQKNYKMDAFFLRRINQVMKRRRLEKKEYKRM
jgi:glycosyltransferase involved in cell wall biosynthesis